MKILMPFIKGNSGSDLFFQYLTDALYRENVSIDIECLPRCLELAPYLAKAALPRRRNLHNYTLVHTNADYGSYFKIGGKPLVVTMHHNVFDENYQKYTSLGQKLYHYLFLRRRLYQSLSRADKVVAVSESTKISLARTFHVPEATVIYNGVDPDLFRPKHTDADHELRRKTKLLFVGNLIRRKGVDLLPKIMSTLGDRYVLLYTSGLRTTINVPGPNVIRFAGMPRDKLVDLYNLCDIFLLPSRLEGFGYAVAEAMACAKPVVCTDSSSLPELVVNHKGGFLCKQDDVADFAEKIKTLGEAPKLRQLMGEFNRERILKNFTLQKTAESYLRLYQRLVNGRDEL